MSASAQSIVPFEHVVIDNKSFAGVRILSEYNLNPPTLEETAIAAINAQVESEVASLPDSYKESVASQLRNDYIDAALAKLGYAPNPHKTVTSMFDALVSVVVTSPQVANKLPTLGDDEMLALSLRGTRIRKHGDKLEVKGSVVVRITTLSEDSPAYAVTAGVRSKRTGELVESRVGKPFSMDKRGQVDLWYLPRNEDGTVNVAKLGKRRDADKSMQDMPQRLRSFIGLLISDKTLSESKPSSLEQAMQWMHDQNIEKIMFTKSGTVWTFNKESVPAQAK